MLDLETARGAFVEAIADQHDARLPVLTAIRQLIVDLLDVTEQSPEETPLIAALDAFAAATLNDSALAPQAESWV